jgi:hypothetical protein
VTRGEGLLEKFGADASGRRDDREFHGFLRFGKWLLGLFGSGVLPRGLR